MWKCRLPEPMPLFVIPLVKAFFSLRWHTRLAVGMCLPLRRTVHTIHQMLKKVNEWERSCVHVSKHRAREQIDGSQNGLGRWICSVVDVLGNFQWDNLLFFSNSIHLSGREITNSTLFILKTVSKESFISEEMQYYLLGKKGKGCLLSQTQCQTLKRV